ncbi:MAG: GNAT family N-acetyltransferase, partial [Burkholderiaceae bacterium]
MTLQIRELQPADAAQFQALRLQALIECPSAFASSYEEEHETAIDVIAERLRSMPDRWILGAFDESRLIGIVGVQREEMLKLAHKAFIWGMYIDPPARQRGVGARLVSEALGRAAHMNGVRQVNLGVNAANVAAISLYESAGFERFGFERSFMLLDGVPQDELMMVRFLTRAET